MSINKSSSPDTNFCVGDSEYELVPEGPDKVPLTITSMLALPSDPEAIAPALFHGIAEPPKNEAVT